METPFIFGKLAQREDFTDREKEFADLRDCFRSLVNTILISPRRWGKSSLVNKVRDSFHDDGSIIIASFDAFNCRTEEDFYRAFSSAVLSASHTPLESFVSAAKKHLGRLVPTISIADPAGQYSLSFGINPVEDKMALDELLDLPQTVAEEKNRKVIVCIDEFQTIGEYSDTLGFQRRLRAHWQRHTNAAYCLYGSKRSMMLNLFSQPDMPFYRFGSLMLLEKISREKWVEFISGRFSDTGKRISAETAGLIAELVENHPYYVQQLSQLSWLRTGYSEECPPETVKEAFESLIMQLSLSFSMTIDSLRPTQIRFLSALAQGEKNLTSAPVLNRYRLGTSANIKSLKDAMLKRDLIDITPSGTVIQDPLFKYWLLNCYLR